MRTIKKRRIEIAAFERVRIQSSPGLVYCPVCCLGSEMLTTRQAAVLAHVKPQSVRRWLADGQAHGVRTSGGSHRVCRNSLFVSDGGPVEPPQPEWGLDRIDQMMRVESVPALPEGPASWE